MYSGWNNCKFSLHSENIMIYLASSQQVNFQLFDIVTEIFPLLSQWFLLVQSTLWLILYSEVQP